LTHRGLDTVAGALVYDCTTATACGAGILLAAAVWLRR
jgi:hypothetical protein